MRVGAKKKNDDLLVSTFQLLNGTEMGSFYPKLSGMQLAVSSYIGMKISPVSV